MKGYDRCSHELQMDGWRDGLLHTCPMPLPTFYAFFWCVYSAKNLLCHNVYNQSDAVDFDATVVSYFLLPALVAVL